MNSVDISMGVRILLPLSVKLNLRIDLIFYGNKKSIPKKTTRLQIKHHYTQRRIIKELKKFGRIFGKILSF